MNRRAGLCVLTVAVAATSSACGDDTRPSAAPVTPSSEATSSSGRDVPSPTVGTALRAELVTAVADYVRARNGTDPQAYGDSMCESVRDAAATRRPTAEVVVDRIEDVVVDGRTATVTVDLSYRIARDAIVHPVRGVEWTFLREGDQWRQCTPPPFGSATG